MWKNKFIVLFIVLSLLGIIVFSPPVQLARWMVLNFIAPNLYSDIKDEWRHKSTVFLLWKLLSYSPIHADIAADILGERKEKCAVPILLIGLRSPLRMTKWRAMLALGEINDKRAIKPLMSIVNRKNKNEDYYGALGALSRMKYEPIIPIILDMTKGNRNQRANAVDMLGSYKDAEYLPILEKIAKEDKIEYVRDCAKEAIEKINKKTER